MRLASYVLIAISLSFLERGSTRALPMDSGSGLNHVGNLLADPATEHLIIIGREIHNADYSNAGRPPQKHAGATSQGSRAGHPNEPNTQLKPRENSTSPQSSNIAKAAEEHPEIGRPGLDAKKHRGPHTQRGEWRHSVNNSQLASGDDGNLATKHTHDHRQAIANSSVALLSRKVTHQGSNTDDQKATPPPPSAASTMEPYENLVTLLDDSGYGSSNEPYLKVRHERQSNVDGPVPLPGNDDIKMANHVARSNPHLSSQRSRPMGVNSGAGDACA